MADQGVKNRVLIVGKSQQEKFVEGKIIFSPEFSSFKKSNLILDTSNFALHVLSL